MHSYNIKLTAITPKLKNKNNEFYLGAWCLANKLDDSLSDLKIHEYHWNNRKKFHEDYEGLNNYISYNFGTISEYMGEITKAPKDQRYWKINLGMWIGYLIQVLFDRWENIRTLPQFKYHLSNLPLNISSLRSNTVSDFFKEINQDQWNETVYQLILRAQNRKINYENSELYNSDIQYCKNEYQNNNKIHSSLKFKIIKNLISFFHKLQQPKYFIIASYLNYLEEIKLKLLLKQIPILYISSIYAPNINYKDMKSENHEFNDLNSINLKINEDSSWSNCNKDFLIWFKEVFSFFIPYNYSLRFKNFYKDMKALPFPKQPNVIFTSNLYDSHDYFNLYTSECVHLGSKYIIGQHGGNFRSAKINFSENIQKDISDYYLTWGEDSHNDDLFRAKIVPIGNLKLTSQNVLNRFYRPDKILILTTDLHRYARMMASYPISSQWLDYFKDIKNFIKIIKINGLYKEVIFRNKHNKIGWKMIEKLSYNFNDMIIDNRRNYFKSLLCSKLVISTYNGATYLESMSMNIPTIIFWNPFYWDLRDTAISDYNMLKSVGILHFDPVLAANFVTKIYPDINKWWLSEEVQKVRKNFCEKYSKNETQISSKIGNFFLKNFN
jgi:putative transferase (TIGR04331 family)